MELSAGRVPGEVDVLLLVAPQGLTDRERFAVDQFLMRGGSVIVLAGSYQLAAQQFSGGIYIEEIAEGLREMLAHYGVEIGQALVMDPQNEPFPIQAPRTVGGMQVIEIQEVDYPFFVDVRSDGMADDSPIVSNLPAVTLHWASPLVADAAQEAGREVTVLLQSSDESWLRTSTDVQPNPDLYPELGFPVEGEQSRQPLAVAVHGSFESYFKGKPSPFEAEPALSGVEGIVTDTVAGPVGTVEVSPESARLVVVGSAEFVDDAVLGISQQLSADRYLNSLQMVQNAVDWAAEDEDLLRIRSRGTYAHLLKPLDEAEKARWLWINYGVALAALGVIGGVWYVRRRNEQPMFEVAGSMVEEGDDE